MSNWLGLDIRDGCQSRFIWTLYKAHRRQAGFTASHPDRNPQQKIFKSGVFVLFYKSTIFSGYLQNTYLQDTHSPTKVLTLMPLH